MIYLLMLGLNRFLFRLLIIIFMLLRLRTPSYNIMVVIEFIIFVVIISVVGLTSKFLFIQFGIVALPHHRTLFDLQILIIFVILMRLAFAGLFSLLWRSLLFNGNTGSRVDCC